MNNSSNKKQTDLTEDLTKNKKTKISEEIKETGNSKEEEPKKYVVYRNDIKYKKHRNIDMSRAIWNDDVKKDFQEKDTDAIDYRIEECKHEKSETIDLTHMDKYCFEQLFSHQSFSSIKKTLQHIFAKDSELRSIPDLLSVNNLQTLDISCNKLKELGNLPESLEELIVNDNKLINIDVHLPKLKRFNGSNNMIEKFNYSNSLERLHLQNNPINMIPKLTNLYFLDISNTKITEIYSMPKLKYLDICNTEINIVPAMPALESLLCNNSSVSDISSINTIYSLEIINSKIKCIHFMPNLNSIRYHDSDKIKLSQRYKILYQKQNKLLINEITFIQNK
jgi:hypothetical protein